MNVKDKITIAIPKGKLGQEALNIINKIGLPTDEVETNSRKLKFDFSKEGLSYLICRATDVPTYVEYGAADLGIVGKDTLVESDADVFELIDLKFGRCKVVVALPKEVVEIYLVQGKEFSLKDFNHRRVATKFPRIAKSFFSEKGLQVEVIKLHGNMELAPAAELAEMIVDIVSTGTTLKTNNLVPVADIFEATARLIANRVSYRIKSKRIQPLINSINKQVEGD
jgi:ATP phosphoribosyltransferase